MSTTMADDEHKLDDTFLLSSGTITSSAMSSFFDPRRPQAPPTSVVSVVTTHDTLAPSIPNGQPYGGDSESDSDSEDDDSHRGTDFDDMGPIGIKRR